MDKDAVEETSRRAIELVKNIPEGFRQATYSVVLAMLLGDDSMGDARSTRISGESKTMRTGEPDDRDEMMRWINDAHLDFSEFETLINEGTWVERAMVVLQVVESETGISALTPPELAQIMKDRLRLPKVYASNLSRDLASERRFFNRMPEGRSYKYSLSRNGLAYLDDKLEVR